MIGRREGTVSKCRTPVAADSPVAASLTPGAEGVSLGSPRGGREAETDGPEHISVGMDQFLKKVGGYVGGRF